MIPTILGTIVMIMFAGCVTKDRIATVVKAVLISRFSPLEAARSAYKTTVITGVKIPFAFANAR
jgi:hypothetical protein